MHSLLTGRSVLLRLSRLRVYFFMPRLGSISQPGQPLCLCPYKSTAPRTGVSRWKNFRHTLPSEPGPGPDVSRARVASQARACLRSGPALMLRPREPALPPAACPPRIDFLYFYFVLLFCFLSAGFFCTFHPFWRLQWA